MHAGVGADSSNTRLFVLALGLLVATSSTGAAHAADAAVEVAADAAAGVAAAGPRNDPVSPAPAANAPAAPAAKTAPALETIAPSPLLAIDQNRATVVERVVREWGEALTKSNVGIGVAQLREMLLAMRADQLLAASLAGSLDGLRTVIAGSLATDAAVKPAQVQAKALGDATADLVYTPVVPCRLFDTRVSQGGLGPLTPTVTRTYSATVPVALQGGVGGCAAPAGTAVAMIQLVALPPTGAGLLQGGASGTGPFASSLMLYQPGDAHGASIPMPVIVANGAFDLIAQFNGVEVAGDLLGYFRAPAGGASGRAHAVVDRLTVSFDLNRTRNFTAVSRPSTGLYCLTPTAGIDPMLSPAFLSIDWSLSSGNSLAAFHRASGSGCAVGQFAVLTYDFAGVLTNNVAFEIFVP